MTHLRDVELAKAYRLLNHGPVTLVTFEHEGAGNVMAASWVMPLDFDPPKLLLVLDRNTYSRDLLEGSGSFEINLPCRRQAELALAVGNCSGRERDKFARHGITPQRARVVQAPIVPGCLAYLECRVIEEPGVQQRHDLFIAEVVAAYADQRGDARKEVEFGIAVAQKGLWREAIFRWQRATEIDPTYAAAFNNLGIAYEQLGKFEQAGKAYEKALELEPQNLTIQQNYDLFKEINDRAKRNTGS